MRARIYIYNAETADSHVDAVVDQLSAREEDVETHDIAAAENREDAIREAMLETRNAVRIGENPDGIYDEDGNPDFSAGVLITQKPTGRQDLYVGADALSVLQEADNSGN